MITTLLAKILGSRNEREIKKILPLVDKINALEPSIKALSDAQLLQKTNEFREQLSNGKTLDDILPEAFAAVREASFRTLGQRHYDVQLIGGIIMHQGKIAEMKTGEGKTLTATLPLYLNALEGKSAILVTVNDYLAKRDSEWMAPIFEFLGLTVGCLQHNMSDQKKKETYASDVIYGTNNELGFDYLRDNMKFRLEDYVQRDLNFAIVDEVDSILIDEARTPLIISGPSDGQSDLYEKASQAVKLLVKDEDYEVEEKHRSVLLTEAGNDKMEAFFRIENMYDAESINILHHVSQALKAHVLFKKDVDYVVRDNEVLIVDEFTGRIMSGRRYSEGLHQSLEAKEGVTIEKESQTLASITLQNFFRLFKKLSGMTGTALTEAEEFLNIYKLDAIAIPTNRPLARIDKDDLIFLSESAKFKAIVEDIKDRYEKGQPVLIGTIAIETSERLSNVLKAENIPHEVLNAKQHEREADIVENAGKPGSIVIATNMAGRGTDIKLTPESIEAGGLYILGTERHESRRIDNQLRGRAGRQGDVGETRFYISLDDNLVRIFGGGDSLKERMINWAGMEEDDVIEDKMVSNMISSSQEKVEQSNFDSRKYLIEYDDVMNQHRTVVYQYRRNVLEGSDQIYDLVRDMITDTLHDIFNNLVNDKTLSPDEYQGLLVFVSKTIYLDLALLQKQSFNHKNSTELEKDIVNFILEQYALFRNSGDSQMIHEAEKWVMLEVIDQAWKQHMLNLDHLKEGINLRSWGQKNPLIEYKREAFGMFRDMMKQIKWEIVHRIFRLDVTQFDSREIIKKREHELEDMRLQGPSDDADADHATVRRDEPKIGRNDDCPCGSGKKFKKCCG